MLPKEFIQSLAKTMDCSLTEAEQQFNQCIDTIKTYLLQDNTLTIAGFGKFSVARKAARTVRHPQIGCPLPVPAKAVPIFKAGDAFKPKFYGFLEEHPSS